MSQLYLFYFNLTTIKFIDLIIEITTVTTIKKKTLKMYVFTITQKLFRAKVPLVQNKKFRTKAYSEVFINIVYKKVKNTFRTYLTNKRKNKIRSI